MNIETPNVSNTGKYCDLVRTNVIIGHTCSLTSNSIKCISARILHSSKRGGGAPVGNMYCVCNTLRMRYVDFSETGIFFYFYSNICYPENYRKGSDPRSSQQDVD